MRTTDTSTTSTEPTSTDDAAVLATLLVVEDDAVLRSLFCQLLRHHGYAVLEATDGIEGVRVAREQRPDLVLMDLNLPRVSGLTATEVLKQHRATARIPVIAISAYDPSERDVLEAGCVRFLSKPVDPRKLLEVISDTLGAAQPAA